MSDSEFEARLQRIALARPAPALSGPAAPVSRATAPSSGPTGWALFSLIWFVFVPFGIAMRIARELYMDLTPEAVHYLPLLSFVAATHLLLLGVSVLAGVYLRSRHWLFWIAFFTWAGYGVGSALIALKNLG